MTGSHSTRVEIRGPASFRALPISSPDSDRCGYVYALRFDNDLVKVGLSRRLRSRLRTHAREAARYGVSPGEAWTSPAHDNFGENEQALIAFGRNHCSESTGREFFFGLRFDDLVDFAESLRFRSANEPGYIRQGFVGPLIDKFHLSEQVLGASVSYIEKQCRNGVWPHTVVLGKLRFSQEHIAAIFEMAEQPAGARSAEAAR